MQPGPADTLTNMYFKCRFNDLLVALNGPMGSEIPQAQRLLLQASTLFELARADDAQRALVAAAACEQDEGGHRQHALARMAYMADDFITARKIWNEQFTKSRSDAVRMKAALGLANLAIAGADWDEVEDWLSIGRDLDPSAAPDGPICLDHIEAEWKLGLGESIDAIRDQYFVALNKAVVQDWNYYVIRSLYGLAKACRTVQAHGELAWTMRTLKAYVDGTEAAFLSHMVNQDFANLTQSASAVRFDAENMSLMVKDQWINFNDSPKMYRFLEVLHFDGGYVDKAAIADNLWPNEDYRPRVHDPRIFDLAKRVRKIIRDSESQAIELQSGRQGYRLSVRAAG